MRTAVANGVDEVARTAAARRDHYLHVWVASLKEHRSVAERSPDILSAAEREQVSCYVNPAHGRDFATGRALLRLLLAAYVGRRPAELQFETGPNGKPMLARAGTLTPAFNISHSGDMMLLAVTSLEAVGVDVERHSDRLDHRTVSDAFFNQREVAALEALPADRRRAAFFTCWTRKEAYMKACGDGFGLPMHRFEVSCPPARAAILRRDDRHDVASTWTLFDLPVGRHHAATVAVPHAAPAPETRLWRA